MTIPVSNIILISGGKTLSKRKPKYRPMDPMEVARIAAEQRRDPGRWGLDHEALALPANSDVIIEGESRKTVGRAQRLDVFALMYFRANSKLESASYDAVRRLQKDLAILNQTQGAIDAIRTTSSANNFGTEDFSIAQREAGRRIAEVLDDLRPWRAKLIRELCESEAVHGKTPDWHAVVRRYIGAVPRPRRGEAVRACCDDLAIAYRTIDNEPRRAFG